MAQNYNIIEKLIVGTYSRIFSNSNTSLKKYSRTIYMVSVLLLMINILSMWLFGRFDLEIQTILNMSSVNFEKMTDNFNLTLNFLEVGLGFSGAFLDFTPEDKKLTPVQSINVAAS